HHPQPRGGHGGAGGVQLGGVPGHQHHLRPQAAAQPGGGLANTAGTPGNHHGNAGEEVVPVGAGQSVQLTITEAEGVGCHSGSGWWWAKRVQGPSSSPAMIILRTSVVPAPISSSLVARNRRLISASQI